MKRWSNSIARIVVINSALRLVLFLIVVLGFSSTLEVTNVSACSGGGPGPTLKQILSSASTIVRARVVESDTAKQNYILQVESYLSGEAGPEFLLLANNSPEIVQGLIDTNVGGGDCIWFSDPLPEFKVGYFILGEPSPDGAYHATSYRLVIWEDSFPVVLRDTDFAVTDIFDQLKFEQFLRDLRNSPPLEPLPKSRYPSTAPLLVTTENGDEYILPVSAAELAPVGTDLLAEYIPTWIGLDYEEISCRSWDCVTSSGDGRSLIVALGDSFAYIQAYIDFRFEADSFLISPIGLAVWQDNALIIYALHDQLRFASDDYASGPIEIPREVARVSIELNAQANADNSVWSPNGGLLAFSDARGLWLWDVFTPDASPMLLRPASSDLPLALEFSGQGRYLAIAQGDERYTLDLLTENVLPFGYISPDELVMIACEPQPELAQGHCQLRLEQLAPPSTLPGWGMEVDQDIRLEWVNDRRVLLYMCDAVQNVCGVIDANAYEYEFGEEWPRDYHIHMSISAEYDLKPAIDFAVQGRNVAILVDSSTIDVNGMTMTFDLESDITGIRWLPSLFYGENPYPPQIDS
jgi:hypothetical protein